jgi:hypothetical protein
MGDEGPSGPLMGDEVALLLQKVACPNGLVPSELAKQLGSLTPLLGLDCVQERIQGPGDEDAARAVASVVKRQSPGLTRVLHTWRPICCWASAGRGVSLARIGARMLPMPSAWVRRISESAGSSPS